MSSGEAASFLWARLTRGAIFALAAFMALQELRIATAIVTIAFTVALAAMAVAGALAFGLGNRELAGRVTRDWYRAPGSPVSEIRVGEPRARGRRAREARGPAALRTGAGRPP